MSYNFILRYLGDSIGKLLGFTKSGTVLQYNTNGKFIAEYQSIIEAVDSVGITGVS